ncbi:MAG: cytochrome C peroxidase [Chloroflexi bacterium]|nr:cytochrome C peroxidase [Chloroflexota bacterium]
MLGKALFWDTQVGSDGLACASCHYQAGADTRTKNQLNPGLKAGDNTFGNSTITGVNGWPQFKPNYQLNKNDFPFHQVADPQREDYNHRVITHDTNDVASSLGVFKANFGGIVPGQLTDNGTAVADPVFNVAGVNVRRVEPRNTPSVINAVFNVDNFFDGRARNQFNGINPFGPLDSSATILVSDNGTLQQIAVNIPNSSLASQAVGPPLSDLEMSYVGRTFPDVGKKMLAARPLAFQRVHQEDSVLGSVSRDGQSLNGLTFATYAEMVQTVFQSKYWDSTKIITFNPDGSRVFHNATENVTGYSQMEANFSLFFGVAVQAYESTLVSDRARFDLFMEGDNSMLTQDEMAGLLTFINEGTLAQKADPVFIDISQGSCTSCHGSTLFSDATFAGMGIEGPIELELAPIMIDGTVRIGTETVLLDNGFYNIGVRPVSEDLGRGDSILGRPLSATRQALLGIPFAPRLPAGAPSNARAAVDGAFKVPILRNVELTGPYFHTGSYSTLRDVLDFYHRHGDFGDVNIANLDSPLANIRLDARIGPSGQDLDADQLIKFLLTLTDDRVRREMAPFDHPQLFVPDGHPGDSISITQFDVVNGVMKARDTMLEIPAIGRNGREVVPLAPLQPFLGSSAIQATAIRLQAGWNTMSTPIRLHSSMDTWGEFVARVGLSYQAAYSWNGSAFQVVAPDYVLSPLDAIFVQANTPATIEIIPYEGVSSPPSKMLTPGWNLVGSAFLDAQMPAKDALVSAFFVPNNLVPNTLPLWGYSQVVSPSVNSLGWTYIRDSLTIPNMILGEGYWVNMVNAGQISGFTSTPLQIR